MFVPAVVATVCREHGLWLSEVKAYTVTCDFVRVVMADGRRIEVKRLPGFGQAEPAEEVK